MRSAAAAVPRACRRSVLSLVALGFVLGCADSQNGSERNGSGQDVTELPDGGHEERPPPLGFRPRSLIVSEPALLAPLSLERLLLTLVASAGVPQQSVVELYQDWWDPLNTGAQGHSTRVTHCDEPQAFPQLNPFSVACPAHEGTFAAINPFEGAGFYMPVAAVNRLDLAPANGGNCGEYRLVYGARDREHFVIVEAVLPNPAPAQGLGGCKGVADFWTGLTSLPDVDVTSALEMFFFEGVGGFAPAIQVAHLGGGPGGGHVRTNTELPTGPGTPWSLLEFVALPICTGQNCHVEIQRTPVSNTPVVSLLAGNDTASGALTDAVVFQLEGLTASSFNEIVFTPPSSTLAGESIIVDGDGAEHFERAASGNAGFLARIDNRRMELGSALTASQLLLRAESQTCAGCHRGVGGADLGGGMVGPRSLGFTHIDRGGSVSRAMEELFLPRRLEILDAIRALP